MRVAAIDLGTNTFLLLVADVVDGKIQNVLHDEVQVIRLGQGVHQSRRFHAEALTRAEECFKQFSETIKRLEVQKTQAYATSAARDVVNANELIELGARFQIPIEVISGEREAELTFLGAVDEDNTEPVAIIDVGGGSTELIYGEGQKLIARESIDVGSVRLTELFVTRHPVPDKEMEKLEEYIEMKMEKAKLTKLRKKPARILAVAGTPTTLATLEQGQAFETDRVHGFKLPVARLQYWTEKLAGMTIAERQKLAGMEPKRADVIVVGAMILGFVAERFDADELEVSIRGLRYGIARSLGKN